MSCRYGRTQRMPPCRVIIVRSVSRGCKIEYSYFS
jgi:hypothetical protein